MRRARGRAASWRWLLAGCGDSGPTDEEQVRATLSDFSKATAAKDYQALCDKILAPSLIADLKKIGLPCEIALQQGLGDVKQPRLLVGAVKVKGKTATAEVKSSAEGEPPSSDTIELERTGRGLADRLAGEPVGARPGSLAVGFPSRWVACASARGKVDRVRTMVRSAGLTLLALLLLAPAAGASTLGVSGNTAVYTGDAPADRVQLQRYDDTRNNASWYIVTDDGGITPQSPCVRVSSTMAACSLISGRDYRLTTGGGADTVTIGAGIPRGTTDLGPGDDTFTGQSAADIVHGGDGNDVIRGAGGTDQLFGDGGNDLVAGRPATTSSTAARATTSSRAPARACPPTRAPARMTSAAARAGPL